MNDKITNIIDSIFSFLLVICSLHCLTSSFDIKMNSTVLIICTAIFVTVFALLAVLEKSKKKYVIALCIISVVYILMIIFSEDILSAQLNYFINCILKIYSKFFSVAKEINFAPYIAKSSTVFFVAVSLFMSGFITTFLIRLKRILPVIAISILSITPCFIIVNTLPDLLPLLIIVTILFTLFIGSQIHHTNPNHSGVVNSIVAVFMTILIMLVYVFNPVESYKRSDWQDKLLEYTQKKISFKSDDNILNSKLSSIQGIQSEVDLSNAEPLDKKGKSVMTVSSPYSGELYLKGISYANYENNTWSILTDEQLKSYPTDFDGTTITEGNNIPNIKVNISTVNTESVLYTPYTISSPTMGTSIYDILIKNDINIKDYYIDFQPFPTGNYPIFLEEQTQFNSTYEDFNFKQNNSSTEYKNFVYQNYLYVPKETKAGMIKYAEDRGCFSYLPKSQIINFVKESVRNSANYSLRTEKVPQGKDISLWLLNESDTGYCVHFATSAAVMLKSLGIPARYVTGYCAYVEGNTPTTITSDNAHAWVEYFDDNIGWVPLDAVPPDLSMQTEISEPTPTEQGNTELPTSVQPTTSIQTTTQQPTTQATSFQISTNPPNNQTKENPISKTIINIVISIICIVMSLLLRRVIIILLRKQFLLNGKLNNRARYLYRYIMRFSKYSHIPIPKEITSIAEKARFSNSDISSKEINAIQHFIERQKNELILNISSIKKLYFKYIIVLI